MSTLTKVCVVLLVLLNLLAVPVFVTHVTVQASWKRAYEDRVKFIGVLKMQGQHKELALQQAVRELNQKQAELDRVQHTMGLKVAELQTEVKALRSTNADLLNQLRTGQANLMELEKTLKVEVARRVELAGQLDVARKENDRLSLAHRRMEDALRKSQAEGERLGKVVKAVREELAERDERIKELEEILKSGAPAKKVAGIGEVPKIEGTITSVKGDLAGINIGSAKGIQPRMKLIIYRASQFVGHLRVQDVGIRDAAGVIFDKRLQPMPGDKVTTTLEQ